MYDTKHSDLLLLYGISPIHAGAGQGLGVVDNPIQRERHTNWPIVHASGVKGAFRDHFERTLWYRDHRGLDFAKVRGQILELSRKLFGKALEDDRDVDLAGAVSVSDARILLFPVRSSAAPFVWVTCPSVLKRFQRDAKLTGMVLPDLAPSPSDEAAIVLCDPKQAITGPEVVLEDLIVRLEPETAGEWNDWLVKHVQECERVLLVSDAVFSALVETAMEVQAQIAILFETGTTKDGSLRYQELLPADSVLYVMTFFAGERTANEQALPPEAIKHHFQETVRDFIQIGGDWSLGRGICRIIRLGNGGQP